MISLTVSGVGAILAAVGGGVLLARCFRQPRGDLLAWAIALLGLLVSLGCQVLGHLSGFDASTFRGMELGGQVIAPLAVALALSEVAARSGAVRFCARLYIPALAVVGVVILTLDRLAQVKFTKAWPDPSVYYQVPPNYVLMFAIGPLTALVAIIAVLAVVSRSGQPGWNAVLPAALMGGAAAVALAYPSLAQLGTYELGVHVPVASEFAVLCAAAALLGWLAADRAGRVRLSALRDGSAIGGSRWDASDGYGSGQPDGGYGQYAADSEYADRGDRDGYRSGLYRSEQPDPIGARSGGGEQDPDGYGWQDDRQADGGDGDWRPRDQDWDGRFATRNFANGDFATGDFATGDFVAGDFAAGDAPPADAVLGDHDLGYRPGGRHSDRDWQDEDAGGRDGLSADPLRSPAETGTAGFFGQIAIYTLIEDRVEEFDRLAERVVEQVRSREPDTMVFIVHAVPSAPMQRILYEVYRDRTAYQRHAQQPYVRQFEADRRAFVLATNIIELGLQQAKVSPFPSVADLFGEPGYDTSGFERPDFLRDYGRTSGQAGSGRREFQ